MAVAPSHTKPAVAMLLSQLKFALPCPRCPALALSCLSFALALPDLFATQSTLPATAGRSKTLWFQSVLLEVT